MSKYILSEDLAVWFGKKKKKKGSSQPKGPWVNICKKKKGGGHPPCGRKDSDKGGYPVCRGAGVAGKMSQKEKDSACRRKREKEKKDTQSGKGQKPTRIKVKNYKKESIDKLTYMILESIVNDSVLCDNCGWNWKIEDGGDDLYMCHKCGNDNTPKITEDDTKEVNPSSKVIKSICDSKKFCSAQGPITFGQLKSIVSAARNKRLAKHIGEGGFKAFIRLLPWFIPQIVIAGMVGSGMRAFNKILKPTLKETPTYKSWWSKTIMSIFNIAEGDLGGVDPLSKIFFISDGLMKLMDESNKLKFAYHISDIASDRPDDEPVPEFFVENELRDWVNKRFLLDPPLAPKELQNFDDVVIPSEKTDDEVKLIETLLRSYTNAVETMSEDVKYHIDNNIPLSDNIFRTGSPKYFDVINEARKLREKGLYKNELDNELLDSDLGKFFIYEGERLPLDFPMINEAEYKGKKVELGKPKSGGSKKWYVYVKNPKTGKVKKVSYGSPVMTAKWNDPGARKSFAARHQCAKKKDKTKAGYWACRAHKDFGKNVPGRFW
jgi:hypothetical protein